MKFNNFYDEKMIAKYVLLVGFFHRVCPSNIGVRKPYYYGPVEYTTSNINALQSNALDDIDNLYDIDVRLRTQQQLINSQPSNRQPSSPQLSKLQLSNQQPNNWQPVGLRPSPVKVERNDKAVIANGLSNRTTRIKPLDNNNDIAHGLFVNVAPRQSRLQQETYRQQAMLAALRRQRALETLRQQAVDSFKQQQAHLFSLMDMVKKMRQENQKRNSEDWQRIIKQRNKHIQRRFYEHALHDDVDDDDTSD